MTPELMQECHEYAECVVATWPPLTDAQAVEAAHIIAAATATD